MRTFETLFVGCYFGLHWWCFPFFLRIWDSGKLVINFFFAGVWLFAYLYFKKKERIISPWLMIPGIVAIIIYPEVWVTFANSEFRSFSGREFGLVSSLILNVIAVSLPFLAVLPKFRRHRSRESYIPMRMFENLFAGCYCVSLWGAFFGVVFNFLMAIIALNFFFTIVWFCGYFYFKKKEGLISPWLMFPGIMNMALFIVGISEKDMSFCIGLILVSIAVFLPLITFLPRFHGTKESYLHIRTFETLFVDCYFVSYPVFFSFMMCGVGIPIILIIFLFTIVWFLGHFYFKKKEGLISPWLMFPGMIVGVFSICWLLFSLIVVDGFLQSFSEKYLNYTIGVILILIAIHLPFLTCLNRKEVS
ncbi:MAG: hypothetical protein LUD39_06175 [Opitutae bacterium]|nr:hypothetical protein [Opitutae bacterium]